MYILKFIKNIKLRQEIIPFCQEMEEQKGKGFYYKEKEFIHHSSLHHKETAFHRMSGIQIFAMFVLITSFIFGLVINWHTTIVITVAILTFLYFADLLFNLFLVFRSFSKDPEIAITKPEVLKADKTRQWPVYTVLCPLYKEWRVVP